MVPSVPSLGFDPGGCPCQHIAGWKAAVCLVEVAHTCSGDTQADTVQPQTTVHSLPDHRHNPRYCSAFTSLLQRLYFVLSYGLPSYQSPFLTIWKYVYIHAYTYMFVHTRRWDAAGEFLHRYFSTTSADLLPHSWWRHTAAWQGTCIPAAVMVFSRLCLHITLRGAPGPQAVQNVEVAPSSVFHIWTDSICLMPRWSMLILCRDGLTCCSVCSGWWCDLKT